MRITSVSTTPNFEARIKLKAPNMQKIKQASVKSMQKPETQKALASTGVSLAGTASIAGGFAMEPDKFHPSLQSLGEVQDATLSLGTAVSTSPLVPMLVGGCNNLSGTNSSASVEEFLFDKLARKRSLNASNNKLESLKDPKVQKNLIPSSLVGTAATVETSGVLPAGSVESLASGADVADIQAVSQIAGMISLAPPASSAFASAFKELESAESSKGFIKEMLDKQKSEKKLPS